MNRRTVLIGVGSAVVAPGAGIGAAVRADGSMKDYDAAAARLRARLGENPDAESLIRYATLAANGHNTQPWCFRLNDRAIDLLADLARRTPAVDPDDHHLFVSLGCAAENLAIAAQATGRPGELSVAEGGMRARYDRRSSGATIFPERGRRPCAPAFGS